MEARYAHLLLVMETEGVITCLILVCFTNLALVVLKFVDGLWCHFIKRFHCLTIVHFLTLSLSLSWALVPSLYLSLCQPL